MSALSARVDRKIASFNNRTNKLMRRLLARNSGSLLRSIKSPDPTPRSGWPVFIVSGARSGSTLLRYILDAHENLACPPESKFIAALWDSLDNPQIIDALRSLGLSTDEICQRMRPVIDGILGDYAARMNKPRWVDKTPGYDRILPFLDKVFEEKVLYIFLVRHPLDSISSLEEFIQPTTHSADADIQSSWRDGGGKYAWAKYWMRVYERIYVYAKMHPDRSHIVKYEDLVTDSEPVLRSLLDFIGESYSPGIERRAFRKLNVGGFQDTKIFRTWRVHGRSVGKWKKWPVSEAEALWELTQPIASKFGYQSPCQKDAGQKDVSSEDGAATPSASTASPASAKP